MKYNLLYHQPGGSSRWSLHSVIPAELEFGYPETAGFMRRETNRCKPLSGNRLDTQEDEVGVIKTVRPESPGKLPNHARKSIKLDMKGSLRRSAFARLHQRRKEGFAGLGW